jgi:hypothetical protein
LINPCKDSDIRRWAAEGLSYLTLDADVKEKLIEDRRAIQALMDLAKVSFNLMDILELMAIFHNISGQSN